MKNIDGKTVVLFDNGMTQEEMDAIAKTGVGHFQRHSSGAIEFVRHAAPKTVVKLKPKKRAKVVDFIRLRNSKLTAEQAMRELASTTFPTDPGAA